MSPQSKTAEPARSLPDADQAANQSTRPVDWEKLQAEFAPSPEVVEAVKRVFEEDAEILRQLA